MTVCFARDNELVDCYTGVTVTAPALLLDVDSDVLIRWGETEDLSRECESYKATPITSVVVTTLERLNADEQAYIINRMMNFTATGFVKKFASKISSDDALDWIHSEMERVPI